MTVMPADVSILEEFPVKTDGGEERIVVRFSTPFGVAGTVFLTDGYDETSYDIAEAHPIPAPAGNEAGENEMLVQVGTNVGEFEVVGWINMLYGEEDEPPYGCSVFSKGFMFDVQEEEIGRPIGELGSWLQLRVRDFTFWMGEQQSLYSPS